MKKPIAILSLLLTISMVLNAKSKTIINPAYDFKNTGIYNLTKIELNDSATLLTIENTFIPHWWVQFNDNEVIRDSDTGEEFRIKGIQGAMMNAKLWMPDSGDSTVVLIFPSLPAKVKKIDYSEGIFGISLDATQAGTKGVSVVSPEIEKWIGAELAKAQNKALINFDSPNFFNDAPARIIGCIKGYDKRSGFTTGIIYASNEMTRDDFPIVVQIHADGRFEAEIPMNIPKNSWLIFSDHFIFNYYIEPGQTLGLILDWEEFLTADRKRNIRYQFKQIEYRGQLADLNHELQAYPDKKFNYDEFDKARKTVAPLDFRQAQQNELQNDLSQFNEYLIKNPITEKAKAILKSKIMIENAARLFDYTMSRDYYAKQDTTNEILKIPIPVEYYNFLKDLDLNDRSLLVVQNFSTFINRFEYCDVFRKAQSVVNSKVSQRPQPQKSILEYFDEENIEITDKERAFFILASKKELSHEDMETLKLMEDVSAAFNEKHKDEIQKYADQYVTPVYRKSMENREIEIWKAKDSILSNDLGLEPNLEYEIAKIRSLRFSFSHAASKENAIEFWSFLKEGIKTPYLIATGDRLLAEAFPDEQFASTPLPEGIGADVFREIIAPFKGKVLFVDFWATSCGPCVAGIKNMKTLRDKYAENPDFDFIFITDERSSPEKKYNDFVKEQDLKNIYRLPKDDYNYLRQLFKFNGIPKYIVIDAKGEVIDDHFEMHNFKSELPKILPKYKL